jgi:hypothetical protein
LGTPSQSQPGQDLPEIDLDAADSDIQGDKAGQGNQEPVVNRLGTAAWDPLFLRRKHLRGDSAGRQFTS